ncbi:NAD(P)-binding protein [Actinophytocola gossypii]|uniref:NAD(P)/FAD-dependent oxidoreductase n=1 Tax=Actinophytocola gossypii TaxID=2812003 RepID=A0ABT2J5T4_9PSEU|nr:NAD(P)-binding protein [Actinophytocola gossypii]MCT2583143.1 NAD(P)/FAD-dependent oxidoreductase [Actinophytocola gossypii]
MTSDDEHHRVVIVGAGLGGIGTAVRLLRRGINDLVILEAAGSPGGTWRVNSYPGCQCDIPSNLYSLSFAPNPSWSTTFPLQPEIRSYVEDVTDRFDLDKLIRYHTDFPHLLAGYPVHVRERGDFPCWVTDVSSAADVAAKALTAPIGRATWTWFDPTTPTLREVFTEVCRPWGTVPRIVDARPLGWLTRRLGERAAAVPELADYAEPWFDLDPDVLRDIPEPWPVPDPDYLGDTGRALLGVSR